METDNIQALTLYIGAWSWRIIGFIFLGLSIVFFSFRANDNYMLVFFISFFSTFVLCELMAWSRAKEFRAKLNLIRNENEVEVDIL